MKAYFLLFLLVFISENLSGQTEPRSAIAKRLSDVVALENAKVWVRPDLCLEKATVVIKGNLIQSVGNSPVLPPDAKRIDLSGCVITAGWLDMDQRIQLPKKKENDRYWNKRIRPERSVNDSLSNFSNQAKELRNAGFCMALLSPKRGILAGSSSLIALHGGEERKQPQLILDHAASIAALDHGGWGDSEYPNSRMGAIALLRQALLDATWYSGQLQEFKSGHHQRPQRNISLEALNEILNSNLPFVGRSKDCLSLLQLSEVASEFKLNGWFIGNGDEFTWSKSVSSSLQRLVLPVDFPKAPNLDQLGDSNKHSLRKLLLWKHAPENPARMLKEKISICFTSHGLAKASDFQGQIRKSMEKGLTMAQALNALTLEPAKWLGLRNKIGTIEGGKLAMLSVFNGKLFSKKTKCIETWVDGIRYKKRILDLPKLSGHYSLHLKHEASTFNFRLEVSSDAVGHFKAKGFFLDKEELELSNVNFSWANDQIHFSFLLPESLFKELGSVDSNEMSPANRLLFATGLVEGVDGFYGEARTKRFKCTFDASRLEATISDKWLQEARDSSLKPLQKTAAKFELADLPLPLGSRGVLSSPLSQEVLFQNATVWTCTRRGILDKTDVWISGGKIKAIGKNLAIPANALVRDLTSKHLSPSIIDAHSHTAIIGGVNEGTQAVTAEVRIQDVINPNDINLYRQLAGGVSVAHLLHGSANPIGGQAATIKLRWGQDAEALKFKGAKKTIKFALGENVKQSNWGDKHTTRYPQSRMGVEQIIRDSFIAALKYKKNVNTERHRRDLELEALCEVLDGDRLIHCHSYRQDEILMLLRLAEDFGFRIGTLQHVLEGYKVAKEIAQHGACASTFSDWWAYKFEVYDAIPDNGAMLKEAGVITSFNSDSNELARRLHLEAAKAVKYGNVSPSEALLFVTKNPAIQLGIDHRVGSIAVGMDADLAVWSKSPLSTLTKCEETWIDGACYFSLQAEEAASNRDRKSKQTLVAELLEANLSEAVSKKESKGSTKLWFHDHNEEEGHTCCPKN